MVKSRQKNHHHLFEILVFARSNSGTVLDWCIYVSNFKAEKEPRNHLFKCSFFINMSTFLKWHIQNHLVCFQQGQTHIPRSCGFWCNRCSLHLSLFLLKWTPYSWIILYLIWSYFNIYYLILTGNTMTLISLSLFL